MKTTTITIEALEYRLTRNYQRNKKCNVLWKANHCLLIVNNEAMMIKNLIIDWLMIDYDPQNAQMIKGYVVEDERAEQSKILLS